MEPLSNFQIITQYFLQGIPFGALVALIAVGYTMVYGIIQLVNFAHGEIFMFAAFFFLTLVLPLRGEDIMWAKICGGILAITWATSLWVFLPSALRGIPRRAAALLGGLLIGYAMYHLFQRAVPFVFAYPLTILHTATLGVTIDRMAYLPLRRAPRLTALITAVGVSLFLLNLSQGIWGANPRRFPEQHAPRVLRSPGPLTPEMSWWEAVTQSGRIQITDWLVFSVRDLIIVLVCVGAMILLELLIHRTRIGRAMRACSMDQTTARLVGVNVDHVVAVTFAVGSAMAAIAAALYILRGNYLTPTMGYIVGVLAFASAVLGGIGNIRGALLGGFILGLVMAMAPAVGQLHGPAWLSNLDLSRWGYSVAYAVMILVIIFRPTGLLGRATATRA